MHLHFEAPQRTRDKAKHEGGRYGQKHLVMHKVGSVLPFSMSAILLVFMHACVSHVIKSFTSVATPEPALTGKRGVLYALHCSRATPQRWGYALKDPYASLLIRFRLPLFWVVVISS